MTIPTKRFEQRSKKQAYRRSSRERLTVRPYTQCPTHLLLEKWFAKGMGKVSAWPASLESFRFRMRRFCAGQKQITNLPKCSEVYARRGHSITKIKPSGEQSGRSEKMQTGLQSTPTFGRPKSITPPFMVEGQKLLVMGMKRPWLFKSAQAGRQGPMPGRHPLGLTRMVRLINGRR